MNSPASTAGTTVAAATVPAPSALPVVCNTTSGNTIAATEFPSTDKEYDARYATGIDFISRHAKL
ncbi:hypothetical protein GCM10018965_000180 [Nonomuraea roseola]